MKFASFTVAGANVVLERVNASGKHVGRALKIDPFREKRIGIDHRRWPKAQVFNQGWSVALTAPLAQIKSGVEKRMRIGQIAVTLGRQIMRQG